MSLFIQLIEKKNQDDAIVDSSLIANSFSIPEHQYIIVLTVSNKVKKLKI